MNRKEQGYSLIEVMVVLVIIISMSAAGVYGWQRWQQQQRLWQTAQQTRDFLEQLREEANWRNVDHKLWLQRGPQGWCLGTQNDKEQTCRKGAKNQFSPTWPEIEISEMTPGLAFFGLRNTAWPGHLILRNSAGEWRLIISVWGRIRLCEPGEGASCV
ncbi:prepilin peptidase-dependent protein [Cronobacter muytjensii]|uniref:prepilin peptidase-dependent protein n=1 Tax=Cronobacter muytjensii TaxID=413501 RepID=UPI001587FA54|nr:prepilin peptidase-dependent protein [Cronobacter muytjensii]NUW58824.1 prepilin peptidase-dependent protein [Cronobacter muytjensii]